MVPVVACLLLAAAAGPVGPAPAATAPDTPIGAPIALPTDDPAARLAAIDARVEALASLRYGVLRTTLRGGARTEERWRYALRRDGSFRVDYSGDTQRVVACDGRILWDYVPAAGAARRIRLEALDPAERKRILEGVLQKVAVPGFRTGVEAAGMTWCWESPPAGAPAGAVVAAGADETGGRIAILIGDHDRILSSEVRRDGRFVLSVVATDHREVASGVFLPTRLTVTAPDVGGEVRVDVRILQPVAGEPLPDFLFHLDPDPAIHIDDVP